jgi:hypothetical protein
MAKNRIEVKSKNLDGQEVTVYVTRPTKEETAKAQIASNKVFKEALIEGALVRKTLDVELEKQGIWNDEKQERVEKLNTEIRDNLTKLKKGGIKLSEARDLAIRVRIARIEVTSLLAKRNAYDAYTAEAQAEAAKIDNLMTLCIKNEKGEQYFKDVDEYRNNNDQPFLIQAANKLITMLYGVDESWESDLPENKFLKKYKFVDDELRLVKDGHYVTIDGKRINENFEYVDEDGNVVDADGNRVDEDGLPIVEAEPFLDDDGNPIIEGKEEVQEVQEVQETQEKVAEPVVEENAG